MKILNLILILSVVFFVGCPSRSTTNSEGEVSDVDTIISSLKIFKKYPEEIGREKK